MNSPPKRVRRSVDASRLAILEMAERHLIAEGPNGVRVQKVARDLGLTDAAVHYHFRGREALMSALLRFSGRKFAEEMAAAIGASDDGRLDLARVAGLLLDFYDRRGAGRLAMWLSLAGWKPEGAGMLEPLVGWLHDARLKQASAAHRPAPDRRDSQMAIAVISAAAFVQSLVGDAILRSVGLEETDRDALIDWVAALVERREDEAPSDDR